MALRSSVGSGGPVRTPGPMTVAERFAFAAGDVFAGGASSLIAVVYLFFLTEVVGLAPGLAGTAVLVAKVWDSINDPLTGALSDRTRTRWGRRRPWIFVGGLLLIGGMALLWNPSPPVSSQVAKMAWAIGSYIVYNTIQTTIAVPYASFSTEVTTDPLQRDRVNTLRLLFSTVASATVTLVATQLLESFQKGSLSATALYAWLVLGFGGLFACLVLLVAVVCRERVPLPPERAPLRFFAGFLAPLTVRPMRFLMGMYLCQAIAWDIVSAMVLYYAANVVVGVRSFTLLALFIVVNVIAFPIVTHLVTKVSKNRLYGALIPLALLAIAVIAFYPRTGPAVGVYVAGAALAIGMAGAQLLPWVMFPDVLDAAELETGRRDAGSFGGLMTFTRGLGTAVTLQVIGLVLQVTGYQPGLRGAPQAGAAVWGIRLIMFVGIAVLLTIGWFVARRYPLTIRVTREMQPRLAELREAENAVVPGVGSGASGGPA
ncbi:MFS transporter [Mariniluteicoccus flavus]